MSSWLDAVRERVGYMLSLPERTVRSLAAVGGGTTSLLTETLFPEVLRGTTLYRIFLGDTQKFVIEKIAQIQKEGASREGVDATDPQYVHKKMIGGALETAGLFAMHFSPLWVFAIAGDAAAGSGVFLHRLIEQLKRNGVIAEDAQVHGLEDLIAAMQDASRTSATAIDTPPLSREEVSKLANDMTESYSRMFSKATDLVPRLETIWERMREVATRENISLSRLGGILTVDAAAWGKKGIGSVLAVGQTGASLFGDKILDSYVRTLDSVAKEGVSSYLRERMTPFLQAATAHFDRGKKTWTESLATKVLGGGPKADEAESAEPEPAAEGDDKPAKSEAPPEVPGPAPAADES